MQIFNVAQIKEWDAYTIVNEPISSIDLMERTSIAFVDCFVQKYNNQAKICIFCGLGNNGGDGLAIARLLTLMQYQVSVYVVRYAEKYSEDFAINLERYNKYSIAREINSIQDFPLIDSETIIIDALFGSGLTRPLQGWLVELVNQLNLLENQIVAVDIPSGLFADQSSRSNAIIQADWTLTFQVSKLAFLLPENSKYVGKWQVLAIQLHTDFLSNIYTPFYLLEEGKIASLLKKREKFSHKGTYGHTLLLTGSFGKMGASVLAAKAALRSGTGLLTVHIPRCGYEILQTAIPEAMISVDFSNDYLANLPELNPYSAIGIGCGMGKQAISLRLLTNLLKSTTIPLVLDADALNLLGENKELLEYLPQNSILTPHPKEFERLTRKTSDNFERLDVLRNFAQVYQVYVILKGANTAIATPRGEVYFNSTGNAGMATAGSGDVLLGIITGLLAQGYSSEKASLLGAYLHGLAGDFTIQNTQSMESMIAGDLIENLGKAFKHITYSI